MRCPHCKTECLVIAKFGDKEICPECGKEFTTGKHWQANKGGEMKTFEEYKDECTKKKLFPFSVDDKVYKDMYAGYCEAYKINEKRYGIFRKGEKR